MKTGKRERTLKREVNVTFRHLVAGVFLVGAGMLMGAVAFPPAEALGEVRAGPPPKGFESGGLIGVPILREIAATLHTMDARLAKVEAVADLLQMELQANRK